jgi:hypothetical protein
MSEMRKSCNTVVKGIKVSLGYLAPDGTRGRDDEQVDINYQDHQVTDEQVGHGSSALADADANESDAMLS